MPDPYAAADAPPEEDGEESEAGEAEVYAKAGRAIRHAIADGDDEGVGRAICVLVKYENAHGDGEEAPGKERPNLAALLLMKRKGKK